MSGTSPLGQVVGSAAELSIKSTPVAAGTESFVEHLNREVARQENLMENVAAEMTTVGPLVAPPPFEIHPAKLD